MPTNRIKCYPIKIKKNCFKKIKCSKNAFFLQRQNLKVITYAFDNIASTVSRIKPLQSQELNTAMTKISHSFNSSSKTIAIFKKKRKFKNNLKDNNFVLSKILQK